MLTITIEGSLEERLKQAAAVSGDEPVSLAQRVLDRNLPANPIGGDSYRQLAALESFIVGMTDWVSKNVPAGHFANDDRESIYQNRGE